MSVCLICDVLLFRVRIRPGNGAPFHVSTTRPSSGTFHVAHSPRRRCSHLKAMNDGDKNWFLFRNNRKGVPSVMCTILNSSSPARKFDLLTVVLGMGDRTPTHRYTALLDSRICCGASTGSFSLILVWVAWEAVVHPLNQMWKQNSNQRIKERNESTVFSLCSCTSLQSEKKKIIVHFYLWSLKRLQVSWVSTKRLRGRKVEKQWFFFSGSL